MKKKLEKSIETITGKIDDKVSGNDALKYSQAILNLANATRALVNE